MAKSVITISARKKMAVARNNGSTIPKIKYIALGSGGVDANGEVISPLAENVTLNNELIRKEYDKCTKISDTIYQYEICLKNNDLVGEYISEIALIDEDEDIVAISNFLAQGKDTTEVTYSINDSY